MTQIEESGPATGPGGPRAGGVPVIERMAAFRSRWPSEDGVAVFNRVYLAAVEAAERDRGGGGSGGREAATALGVRCAERYLSAVEAATAGGRVPECWHSLVRYRGHPGVRPVQFALSGLQAHVAHDLVLAVVDTCRTLGCAPADLEGQFEGVGDLLVSLEERVREDLTPGPELLVVADPLTHLLSCWHLERAREAAWTAARTLWGLRGFPSLAAEFRQRTDAGAGLVSRLLLTPCP
ncbi:DUF5995 family protein [Streptomyces sp. NPDC049916]|uniref:DUF5995 family protein n=1 Tax=Streptomyces sp. NPDC049916 TaxID=3155156 RepID=UPI00343A30FA